MKKYTITIEVTAPASTSIGEIVNETCEGAENAGASISDIDVTVHKVRAN